MNARDKQSMKPVDRATDAMSGDSKQSSPRNASHSCDQEEPTGVLSRGGQGGEDRPLSSRPGAVAVSGTPLLSGE